MKTFRSYFIIFLVFSFSLISIPYNLGSVYASDDDRVFRVLGSQMLESGSEITGSGPAMQGDINTVCSGNIDVRSSLFLSVITLCLPGILERIQDLNQIGCDRVVCYYDSLVAGLPTNHCDLEYSYNTCRFVAGELFALPGFNTLEHIRNVVAQILADPIGFLAATVVVPGMRSYVAATPVPNAGFDPVLFTAATTLIVVDYGSFRQTLRDLSRMSFSSSRGTCERIPEIREEVEDILRATA